MGGLPNEALDAEVEEPHASSNFFVNLWAYFYLRWGQSSLGNYGRYI